MSKIKVITAIRKNDWQTALDEVAKILDAKVTQALAEEKQDVATGLLVPRIAETKQEPVIDVMEDLHPGDRVRTKRMGQTPGTVVKVENGNVYFELDEPEGKFGKRIWVAPLSNIVKEDVKLPPKKPLPKAWTNHNRDKNDEPICHNCEKPGSKCDCEPGGSFGEGFLDKFRKKPQPSLQPRGGKAKCDKCGHVFSYGSYGEPMCPKCNTTGPHLTWLDHNGKPINENHISQHEVQRVYDEVGDIGETELLCGIRSLNVNPAGQVVSYICEAKDEEWEVWYKWGDAYTGTHDAFKTFPNREAANKWMDEQEDMAARRRRSHGDRFQVIRVDRTGR